MQLGSRLDAVAVREPFALSREICSRPRLMTQLPWLSLKGSLNVNSGR
jgi:hypothetical protein